MKMLTTNLKLLNNWSVVDERCGESPLMSTNNLGMVDDAIN